MMSWSNFASFTGAHDDDKPLTRFVRLLRVDASAGVVLALPSPTIVSPKFRTDDAFDVEETDRPRHCRLTAGLARWFWREALPE
jgi:hypothetical protein